MAAGPAEQVAEALRDVLAAGVDYLALRPVFEFVEQAELHEQLRRLAEEVVPLLDGSGGGVRFLLEHPAPAGLDDLVRAAEAAHAAGLDGVLVTEWPQLPGALVSAAAVAARVGEVLVAAEIAVGDRHPVEIAEEAAVTDLASGGRLVLVARPAGEEHRTATPSRST